MAVEDFDAGALNGALFGGEEVVVAHARGVPTEMSVLATSTSVSQHARVDTPSRLYGGTYAPTAPPPKRESCGPWPRSL